PVVSGKLKDTLPVEFAPSTVNDVCDVGSVEALAAGHEEFRGEKFFCGQNSGLHSMYRCGFRPVYPGLIDDDRGIAHPGYEIDKESVAVGLKEPDRVAHFRFESFPAKQFQGTDGVFGSEEQVEIFRVTAYASVLLKCEGPCYSVGSSLALEEFENLAKKQLLFRWEYQRFRSCFGSGGVLGLGHGNVGCERGIGGCRAMGRSIGPQLAARLETRVASLSQARSKLFQSFFLLLP